MSKKKRYNTLVLILLVLSIAASMYSIVVAHQAKNIAEWVNDKQDNIIEKVIFNEKLP